MQSTSILILKRKNSFSNVKLFYHQNVQDETGHSGLGSELIKKKRLALLYPDKHN